MKTSEYPVNLKRIMKLGTIFTMLAIFFMIPVFVPFLTGIMDAQYWVVACVICWFAGILLNIYGNMKGVYYRSEDR